MIEISNAEKASRVTSALSILAREDRENAHSIRRALKELPNHSKVTLYDLIKSA